MKLLCTIGSAVRSGARGRGVRSTSTPCGQGRVEPPSIPTSDLGLLRLPSQVFTNN